jgi:hypothetical protein
MKITIHQPQYMPWMGYFHKMASADLFIFLDDVQFKKNEWQNRNRIRNNKDWQWLSIPNSYSFPQKINEVKLKNDTDWRQNHFQSLKMCYGRAPHFNDYSELFRDHYARRWETMDTATTDSVKLLAGILGITTPTDSTSRHHFEGASTERLVNICRHFGADVYLAGAGGKDYMDESLFVNAGIAIEYQEFTCPRYPQHWAAGDDAFIPSLSALDLIFNCGPQSRARLMGQL